jgi:hypothetical protein
MYTRLKEERGDALTVKVMPTERCSQLTLKGLYHDFDEMWIAEQPALAVAYLADHVPRLAKLFATKVIAKNRLTQYYAGLELKNHQ